GHTSSKRDWSSDVCSSDLAGAAILLPSCTLSRTTIFFSHLPEVEAGQPPQTKRKGWPFNSGISSSFIAQAIKVSSSNAFDIGTPREIDSLLASPLGCKSAP